MCHVQSSNGFHTVRLIIPFDLQVWGKAPTPHGFKGRNNRGTWIGIFWPLAHSQNGRRLTPPVFLFCFISYSLAYSTAYLGFSPVLLRYNLFVLSTNIYCLRCTKHCSIPQWFHSKRDQVSADISVHSCEGSDEPTQAHTHKDVHTHPHPNIPSHTFIHIHIHTF